MVANEENPMKKTNLPWLSGLFAVLSFTALGPAPAQAQAPQPAPARNAKAAPALYVYDFYASWCHNCTVLKPTLSMLENKYRGKVQFIPVDIDADSNQQLVNRAGVSAVPTLVIVDKQGRPVKRFVGADEAKQLDPAIGTILNQAPKPGADAQPARS